MESLPNYLRFTNVRFEDLEARRLMSAATPAETWTWAAGEDAINITVVDGNGTATTGSIAVGIDGKPATSPISGGTSFQMVPVTMPKGSAGYVLQSTDAVGVMVVPPTPPAPEPPLAAPTPATRAESDMEMPLGTVVQDDGKVLVATLVGTRLTGANSNSPEQTFDRVALVRYLADGSIDTTFGVDGYSTYTLAEAVTSDHWSGTVAVDADGGILVAHYNGINRFLADGSVDLSFGENGTLAIDSLDRIKLAPGGKILAVDGDDTVRRYDADGTVDATFTPFQLKVPGSQWQNADIEDVAVGADGSVYVVGEIRTANADPFSSKMTNAFIAKLNADGTLDTSFADDGRYEMATPNWKWEGFRGVTVLADGKIQVVGGYDELTAPYALPVPRGALLARFNADGTLDTSYGTGGVVITPGITINATRGTLILPDGTLVASTYGKNGAAVLVANADGSDPHLVQQPITLANGNAEQETTTYAPTLAPDGAIVVAVGVANIWSEGTALAAETYWTRIDLNAAPPAPGSGGLLPAPEESPVDAADDTTGDDVVTTDGDGATPPTLDSDADPIFAAIATSPTRATRSPFWSEFDADPSRDDLLSPLADDVLV